MPGPGWSSPSARWLLLAPDATVQIEHDGTHETVRRLRALPSGTPVAIVGRRGLRAVARQGEIDTERVLLALPDRSHPVAVTGSAAGLSWIARSVLTVPPGRRRHLVATLTIRCARRTPWLLRAVGDRVLIGRRQ